MKTVFKIRWYATAIVLCLMPLCGHAGGQGSGGGDLCEDRIQEVREDIKSWIIKGGPASLVLPPGVSVSQYSQKMLGVIAHTQIACVGKGDPGFPVLVNGTPKVCAFSKGDDSSNIGCDFSKFQSMSASDQYVLVHHEFAGIAGFESPNGNVSTYLISNQVSGYLTTVEVQRLAVNPVNPQRPISGVTIDQFVEDIGECLGIPAGAEVPPSGLLLQLVEEIHSQNAIFPAAYQPGFAGSPFGGRGECEDSGQFHLGQPATGSAVGRAGLKLDINKTANGYDSFRYFVDIQNDRLLDLEVNEATNFTGDACIGLNVDCSPQVNIGYQFTPSQQGPLLFRATCEKVQTDSLGAPLPRRLKSVMIPGNAGGILHFKNGKAPTAIAIDWNSYTTCMGQKLQQQGKPTVSRR